MSNSSSAASAAITRTGKAKYDPADSDLYATNAAPPARMLPKTPDYEDAAGNAYYDVFKSIKLSKWAAESPLMDMIAGDRQDVGQHVKTKRLFVWVLQIDKAAMCVCVCVCTGGHSLLRQAAPREQEGGRRVRAAR
jgi:hypothetical protein